VSDTPRSGPSRRELIKTSGKVAVASALAGLAIPHVYAGSSDTIQVALVGCGGRGTGAAENALRSKNGPTKLVAMADVFQDRLAESHGNLSREFKKDKLDVPEGRRFIGFDAYKKAMDSLKPGDVVIFATPPAFRWVHFGYAIQKGLNVFMEKPITVDGPSTRKMLKLGEDAKKRSLKVAVGLMCRHCAVRHQLLERIGSGAIGDIPLLRAYRMQGIIATFRSEPNDPKKSKMSDLAYQIRRFHSFLWASGGCYSDFLIHHIDECCWTKDVSSGGKYPWPVKAQASGGRHYRNGFIDQNFDVYSVEYIFGDGARFFLEGRNIDGCQQEFASYAHGTKGSAVISERGHSPAHCRILKGQDVTSRRDIVWKGPRNEPDPYQLEWDDLLEAIRQDKPYNEVERGAKASLVTAMGRMAAHTGQIISFDQMLNCEHEFAPSVDQLTMDSPAPVLPGADGKYPVPEPGIKTKQEY
jgi:predicted dehydrogenase